MNKFKGIYQRWRDFVVPTYPSVQRNSAQYREMELVFFSAWFDCLSTLKYEISELPESQRIRVLETLLKEAESFCLVKAEEGKQR